jgi:hypothetical protein
MHLPTPTHRTAPKPRAHTFHEDAALAGWSEFADRLACRHASTVIDASILASALAIFAMGALLAP